jgi:hypothetical protein
MAESVGAVSYHRRGIFDLRFLIFDLKAAARASSPIANLKSKI